MILTKKLILTASALCVLLVVTGCGDYIPRTVFEIETKAGQTIKMACPVIDQGRSTLSYLIDGDCVVYN